MAGHEKTEIRTKLNEFLLKHHRSVPGFVSKKVIKLIVDIASTDWPHFYPDFFNHIMECIYRHDTLLLGLSMLLITSEELATPRDNVSSARKEELRRLLCAQVPQVNYCSVVCDTTMRNPTNILCTYVRAKSRISCACAKIL